MNTNYAPIKHKGYGWQLSIAASRVLGHALGRAVVNRDGYSYGYCRSMRKTMVRDGNLDLDGYKLGFMDAIKYCRPDGL